MCAGSTRIDSHSVEQVVSLDGTDEIYNWPVALRESKSATGICPRIKPRLLREYSLRGGFLMVDDFHSSNADDHPGQGINEWENFRARVWTAACSPIQVVKDIPDADAMFHTLYDLGDRFQVPGAQYRETHLTYEKAPPARSRTGARSAT